MGKQKNARKGHNAYEKANSQPNGPIQTTTGKVLAQRHQAKKHGQQ